MPLRPLRSRPGERIIAAAQAWQELAMDDFILARALHVVAVVAWIGGVAFVTTALMPAIRRHDDPAERLRAFHRFESRFAPQARLWVLLAGASGFWMAWRADLWSRFEDAHFWWMHAMVALWLVFALMLFVVEPLVVRKRLEHSADPGRQFARMERLHRILLALALLTVLGAVAGSHGWAF
jgi:uncharacterized membrane protein